MTTLAIVANHEKKRLSLTGTVAAGEHVAVTLEDGWAWANAAGAALRLRVVFAGKLIAEFPRRDADPADTWSASGDDATCELNINSVPAAKHLKFGGDCIWVLDDPQLNTLYGVGELEVLPWRREPGGDVPYNLDGYPDLLNEFEEVKDAVSGFDTKKINKSAFISLLGKTLPETATQKEVREMVHDILELLKNAAVCAALAFALPAFGIDADTAWEDVPPQLPVKNVVEQFSLPADFSTNNTELVETIEATAPAPGDYAAVSNAAVHAAITNALQNVAIAGKASKSDLDPLLLTQYYPDGSVKSASELTTEIKYTLDETNHTATVKKFNNSYDSENDNSGLAGRVVIPPFVDAQGNPYLTDDGSRYRVVAVGGDEEAVIDNTDITAIVAPSTVTIIGNYLFMRCTSLSSVSFPAATNIGLSAFKYCVALTSVSLPAATSIGINAIRDCDALTSVSLPAATNIGNFAFFNCDALTSVSLPVATSIGNRAFDACISLASVDFGTTTRSSVPTLGSGAFNNVPNTCTIIVPDAMFDIWTAETLPDTSPNPWYALVQAGYKFLRHSEWEYARRYETAAHETAIQRVAEDNAQTRQIVTTWENFLDGSNVVFSITNYISGTYNLDAAKMTIKELRDGSYREVYNSRDEILLHFQNFKDNDFKNATNQVIGAVNAAIENKADRDWGKYTSAGGEAPENTVYMTAPHTVFAGGLEYERVAVGEGTICVLTTRGAPVWTQGDEGTFKFQDEGSTNYFGFAKTDSYTIGANTDGITVQGGMVTMNYNITMSGRPCVWYKADLASDTPWEQLNLPDGSPVAGASHVVTWEQNPPADSQVCYINVGNAPSGFFRATVEVAGSAKFMTNMPADFEKGILCPNTATGEDGVIKAIFNGMVVEWVWSKQ